MNVSTAVTSNRRNSGAMSVETSRTSPGSGFSTGSRSSVIAVETAVSVRSSSSGNPEERRSGAKVLVSPLCCRSTLVRSAPGTVTAFASGDPVSTPSGRYRSAGIVVCVWRMTRRRSGVPSAIPTEPNSSRETSATTCGDSPPVVRMLPPCRFSASMYASMPSGGSSRSSERNSAMLLPVTMARYIYTGGVLVRRT